MKTTLRKCVLVILITKAACLFNWSCQQSKIPDTSYPTKLGVVRNLAECKSKVENYSSVSVSDLAFNSADETCYAYNRYQRSLKNTASAVTYCMLVNKCDDPGFIGNSTRSPANVTQFDIHDLARYTCIRNFRFSDGTTSRRCYKDSTWSPNIPRCEELTPMDIEVNHKKRRMDGCEKSRWYFERNVHDALLDVNNDTSIELHTYWDEVRIFFREPRKVYTFTVTGFEDCKPLTGLMVFLSNEERFCPDTCDFDSSKLCLLAREDPGFSCTFHCDAKIKYTYLYYKIVQNTEDKVVRLYDFIVE